MIERPYATLFRRYAEAIVYKPSLMTITVTLAPNHDLGPHGKNVNFLVRVHADDIGLLCGAKGKIIAALQNILRKAGLRNKHTVRVSVDKFGERGPEINPPMLIGDQWTKTPEAIALVKDTMALMGVELHLIDSTEQYDTTLLQVTANIREEEFDAVRTAIRAWGKSQGRYVVLLRPDEIKSA